MSHPIRHHTRRDTGSNREMPPNHTTSARTHDNHEHDARTHASKRNYLIFPLTSTPTRHHLPISACYLLALSDQSIITEVPSYNQREATHADVDARARNSAGTATKCKQEEAFADPIPFQCVPVSPLLFSGIGHPLSPPCCWAGGKSTV